MNNITMIYIGIAIALLSIAKPANAFISSDIEERIRQKVELIDTNPKIKFDNEAIFATYYLPQFYINRSFQTAWLEKRSLKPSSIRLIDFITMADREGLNPRDYHLDKINAMKMSLEKGTISSDELVNLELLLTDAYLTLAAHIIAGKVNPENVTPEWKAQKRNVEIKLDNYLAEAIHNNKVAESLTSLAPKFKSYERLKAKLKSLYALKAAGGWPTVMSGEKLEDGMRNDRVRMLRERLESDSYLDVNVDNRDFFDAKLKSAVIEFQRDHGLLDDGIAGVATVAALNVSIDNRIDQIKVNMERCRWLSDDLGEKHLLINIAAFELNLIENGNVTFNAKAIVGRTYRKTPVFSGSLSYIVLNPYWTIPSGILKNDILPEVRKNVGYLAKKNIKVIDGKGNVVNPSSVDWQSPSAASYMFRQDPGKDNALGLVKFMFPNSYSVYIHDTPSKELFESSERAFSSGCIRVQKPLELASFLLIGQDDWTLDKILGSTANPKTPETIYLTKPVPVHIVYFTSYYDLKTGKIRFLKDVYDRDKAVSDSLKSVPAKI
ncbi:MAG: L,D-transpeptidase family protein [Chitinophagales bacterium]|nr:L,D-transpeptidase family protein [Chitinophagales bacterium]